MKKSVFTLLAIATAVFTMSSCSKDDAGSNAVNTSVAQQTNNQGNQTPSTQPTQAQAKKGDVFVAQFAVSENLAQYGTFSITISDGTDSKTIDLAKEGQKVDIKGKTSDGKAVTLPCIKYTYVQKTSKQLTYKTTFTPNDAAKQLTSADKVTASFGCSAEMTTTGKASSELTPRVLEDVLGNKVAQLCEVISHHFTED